MSTGTTNGCWSGWGRPFGARTPSSAKPGSPASTPSCGGAAQRQPAAQTRPAATTCRWPWLTLVIRARDERVDRRARRARRATPLLVARSVKSKERMIGCESSSRAGRVPRVFPTKVGYRWSQLSPDMGMRTVDVADYVTRHRGSTNGLPGSGVGQGSTRSYLGPHHHPGGELWCGPHC
jgi:hypothetical protein